VTAEDSDLIEAVQYMSACCARLGLYDEAAEQHERLLQLAARRGHRQLRAETLANQGVMHYLKGEYHVAHEQLAEAARLTEELGLATERAQISNNAGFALYRLGRLREAEQAFQQSVEIFRTFGALAALVSPYNGLGNVMLAQQRYDEAWDYYRRALLLAQEVGDRTNTGASHMHLGRCAALQGRFAAAKNEFALALNTLEGTSFWNVLARTYEFMAEMNLRLGHDSEALRCAQRRAELARRHANWPMEQAAWRQQAAALERMGRAEDARDCLAAAERGPEQELPSRN
jgi:tetratricopeptide (TPR) repeat protein